MGCDIHAVWQAKKDGKWIDVPSKYDEDRDYELFAWLAGVRNRFDIKPIDQPRGLPEDFEMESGYHPDPSGISEYTRDGARWMGDHSFSWFTADELLAAPAPDCMKSGLIALEQIKDWDGKSNPSSYCQDAFGPNIRKAESLAEIRPGTTHVRVSWPIPKSELKYFLDEVRAMRDQRGKVRFVFGFDN